MLNCIFPEEIIYVHIEGVGIEWLLFLPYHVTRHLLSIILRMRVTSW